MLHHRYLFVLLSLALLSGTAQAAPTLKEALDGAWAKHPLTQARAAREQESRAKREQADSWLADAPKLAIGQRSDRWNANRGAVERELELSAPLQLPGARDARTRVAEREGAQLDSAFDAEKWRLAGEVREAYWQARIADNEKALASRKVADAAALAADVKRRFDAGDVARTDWNQAEAAVRAAQAAEADTNARQFRAMRNLFALTGLDKLPEVAETPPATNEIDPSHPAARELGDGVALARARVTETGATRRDPPELSIATIRERSAFGEANEGSVALRLTIPLGMGAKNRARQAGANADRIEAETRLQRIRIQIEAEVAIAREELAQAIRQVELNEMRASLAQENQRLLAKAYDLGELDLAVRLRAEAERFDADLAASRARLERARSISRLNQSLGKMP